jgi:hypothetical protein
MRLRRVKNCQVVRFRQPSLIRRGVLVFYVVTPCGLMGRYQRLGGTYWLHLQLWLIFPESWPGLPVCTIIRFHMRKYFNHPIVDPTVLPHYTAPQPRRQPSWYSPPWEPQISLRFVFLFYNKRLMINLFVLFQSSFWLSLWIWFT